MGSCPILTKYEVSGEQPKCVKRIRVFSFIGFFFLVAAIVCLSPVLFANEHRPRQGAARPENAPNSIVLKETSSPPLAIHEDFSQAIQSECYPEQLAARIRRIAESEAPECRASARWASDILAVLAAMVWYRENNELEKAWSCLGRIEQEILRLAGIRSNENGSPPSSEDERSPDRYVPTSVALEEIQLALERRAILWRQALSAEAGPSLPVSKHFARNNDDLRRLRALTLAVEDYFLDKTRVSAEGEPVGALWCAYLDTTSFISELEACRQLFSEPHRRVSQTVSTIPIPMLVSFCDRANVILSRLDERELTQEQNAYLSTPTIIAWKEELKQWSADTVSPRSLIVEMERFEANSGMNDMERLFRLATRLSFSKTEAFRNLGLITHDLYGGANVKIYVSKALVNHLLPPMEPEVASFREVIQNQQVVGRREAEMDIQMNFIPDADRLLLSLDLKGRISTSSRAKAFATTLFNLGQADCTARKRIELTADGFVLSPTVVDVPNNRIALRNFQTEFDGVPLLSGLVRGVVRNQYEARQVGAREETRRKIARQIKARVDQEADGRFAEFNDKFRQFMSSSMTEFDIFLEKKNAGTEENWLLTSWAIRSQDSLCGNTPAPETLPGSFADVKVHESALNTILGKLEIDGAHTTVGQLKQRLAERFQRPGLAEPGENDDVEIAFSAYNPLTVRFVDGRIEIAISIDALRIQRQTHRNFQVLVRYRPSVTPDGELVLERDGVISLVNARAQIVLRAVFGKIFPEKRPVSLTPKFLNEDPRFETLSTGHCRIEKGWFALALVAKEAE